MNANPKTIILVEDDAQTVVLFNNMFRRNGFRLVCITPKDIAYLSTFVELYQPMLIILDYMTIKRYFDATVDRLDSLDLNLPILMMTTIEDEKLSAVFNRIIRKPFSPSQILDEVREAIA